MNGFREIVNSARNSAKFCNISVYLHTSAIFCEHISTCYLFKYPLLTIRPVCAKIRIYAGLLFVWLIVWQTGRNIRVVFDSGPFAPLCENMTSSSKPEVYNVLHCRQRRTEPRPQVTRTENLKKLGRLVFELSERTYRQKYRQTYDRNTILRTP